MQAFEILYNKEQFMKDIKNIAHNLVGINQINNQAIVTVTTTLTNTTNTFTSLGGAIGTIRTSEDYNKLINEAITYSYQNMHIQAPNMQGISDIKEAQIPPCSSSHQLSQNTINQPLQKQHSQKQGYSKQHSTTRRASEAQQNLIRNLCNEKGKDLNAILAQYNKELSTITSADANTIIQEIKNS